MEEENSSGDETNCDDTSVSRLKKPFKRHENAKARSTAYDHNDTKDVKNMKGRK